MLGCIKPMSSPMMKRMFGFFSCAAAGIAAHTSAARMAAETTVTVHDDGGRFMARIPPRCFLRVLSKRRQRRWSEEHSDHLVPADDSDEFTRGAVHQDQDEQDDLDGPEVRPNELRH